MLLDWLRSGLSAAFIVAGALIMLGAVLGLLRFPDVFTRLHAGGATMALGVCVCLFGVLILSGTILIAAKLAFLIALIAAVAPVLSHIVGSAAHAAGISPVVGAYTAPRPGRSTTQP
jgi:multicomponent Na+:H+ antiporter subunit G